MNRFPHLALPLSAAVGAVLAAGAAFGGVDPTATTSGNILKLSGSSAIDRTFYEAILDNAVGVCSEGSTGGTTETANTAIYETSAASLNTTTPNPGSFSITCLTPSGALVSGQQTQIAIEKFSGGSESAIDPVALGNNSVTVSGNTTNINMVDTTQALSNCTDSGFVAATGSPTNRISFHVYTKCPVKAQIPQAGTSDVNPSLFSSIATGISLLSVQAAHAFPWQIIVSKPLYNKLQTAQGIGSSCQTGTVTDQADACMPSLNAMQVRALLSGHVNASTSLFGIAAASSTAEDNSAGSIPGSSIIFCSRSKLSGTRKAHEVMYFDEFCQTSVPSVLQSEATVSNSSSQLCNDIGCTWAVPFVSGVAGSTAIQTSANGNPIFSGSGTGDVTNCVDYASTNGAYAVGISSADRQGTAASGGNYWAVKIDGAAPTLENVMSQKYQYYTENTIVQPNSSSTNLACNTGTGEGFNCGNRSAIWTNLLISPLRSPTLLEKTLLTSANIGGTLGFLVRPNSSFVPATTDTPTTRPVNSTVRLPALVTQTATLNPVNDCNPPEPAKVSGFVRN